MTNIDDMTDRLRAALADFWRRLLEEVREIYNDLQKLPIGIVVLISALALLFVASVTFGLHA